MWRHFEILCIKRSKITKCIIFLAFSFDEMVNVNNSWFLLLVGSYWRWYDSIATSIHVGAICHHWCIIPILLFELDEQLFRSFHGWSQIRQPDFSWLDYCYSRAEYANNEKATASSDIKLGNRNIRLHWKHTVSVEFCTNRLKLCVNCRLPQNFNIKKFPEVSVFYPVCYLFAGN